MIYLFIHWSLQCDITKKEKRISQEESHRNIFPYVSKRFFLDKIIKTYVGSWRQATYKSVMYHYNNCNTKICKLVSQKKRKNISVWLYGYNTE